MLVVPSATPVTTPVALIVAIAVLLLAQTPPVVASAKASVLFTHTLNVAGAVTVIAATVGKAFTVILVVTLVIQLLALVTL